MTADKIRTILTTEAEALFVAAERVEDRGTAEDKNAIRRLVDAAEGLTCISEMPDHAVIRFAELFRDV